MAVIPAAAIIRPVPAAVALFGPARFTATDGATAVVLDAAAQVGHRVE